MNEADLHHTVRQGESMESIAFEHGHFWETLWQHPANAELRQVRQDPHVLMVGDDVFVPAIRVKSMAARTDGRHVFRRRGVPSWLHVIVKIDGVPRANEPFTLTIDGQQFSGVTSPDGSVRHSLMPNAAGATLIVGMGGQFEQHFELQLRELDPVDTMSGLCGRLRNLGFLGASDPERLPRDTRDALIAYQAAREMSQTGEADAATKKRLLADHGS